MVNNVTKIGKNNKYSFHVLPFLSRRADFILLLCSILLASCSADKKSNPDDVEPVVIDTPVDSAVRHNPDVIDSVSAELNKKYNWKKSEQEDKKAKEAYQKIREEKIKSSQFRGKSCETLLLEYEDLLKSQEDMASGKFNYELKEIISDPIFLNCKEDDDFRLEIERLEKEYL